MFGVHKSGQFSIFETTPKSQNYKKTYNSIFNMLKYNQIQISSLNLIILAGKNILRSSLIFAVFFSKKGN